MFRESRQLPKTLYAASALALVLGAGMVGDYVDFDVDIVPSAHAAQQAGGRGEKGAGPSGDVRGGGVKKGGSEGSRGGKSMKDVLAEEDDDSDRPDWVDQWKNTEDKKGGPPTTHRPGEKPRVPGTNMGDTFGDLWVLLRTADGTPVYVLYTYPDDVDGVITQAEFETREFTVCTSADGCFVQPLDAEGNLIPLDAEGKPLVIYGEDLTTVVMDYSTVTQEFEIGRSNVARSPDKVIENALDEALGKLVGDSYTATLLPTDGSAITTNIYTDPSGRLVYYDSAESVWKTIDSPLENLALYQALLDAAVDGDGAITDAVLTLPGGGGTFTVAEEDVLDLAASLLAAAADKTMIITVDYVEAVSTFLDVQDELTALIAAGYSYDGTETTYAFSVPALVQLPNTTTYVVTGVNLVDGSWTYTDNGTTYTGTLAVDWTDFASDVQDTVSQDDVTTGDTSVEDWNSATGITAFTETADDALQVLEFVHDHPVPE